MVIALPMHSTGRENPLVLSERVSLAVLVQRPRLKAQGHTYYSYSTFPRLKAQSMLCFRLISQTVLLLLFLLKILSWAGMSCVCQVTTGT
jgi:hypothetical protein